MHLLKGPAFVSDHMSSAGSNSFLDEHNRFHKEVHRRAVKRTTLTIKQRLPYTSVRKYSKLRHAVEKSIFVP
jgi:hypothetical protein